MNRDTISLFTLAAAAASANGADQNNLDALGVEVVVDLTAVGGTTPTLVVTIEGKDPVSGKYYTLLASATLNATGTTVMTVFPGVTVAANVAASRPLPRTWRVKTTIGGTTPSFTGTIAACTIGGSGAGIQ